MAKRSSPGKVRNEVGKVQPFNVRKVDRLVQPYDTRKVSIQKNILNDTFKDMPQSGNRDTNYKCLVYTETLRLTTPIHYENVITEMGKSEEKAQDIIFLSWLYGKYPKLNLLGNVPIPEVEKLVKEFCDEKHYSNYDEFSKDVIKVLKGDADKPIIAKLRGYLFRNNSWYDESSPDSIYKRYGRIPFHAMFFFTANDDFPLFAQKHWEDMNYLTSDHIDVYYSKKELNTRVSGYELLKQFDDDSINNITSLPALVIWKETFSKCQVIPLRPLSHDEIFDLMIQIVEEIKNGSDLGDITKKSKKFIKSIKTAKSPKPEVKIISKEGDVFVAKKGSKVVKNTATNSPGAVVGSPKAKVVFNDVAFGDMIKTLDSRGKQELSKALDDTKNAITASPEIKNDAIKQDHVDILSKIGEEAAKVAPDIERIGNWLKQLKIGVKDIPAILPLVAKLASLLGIII